MKFHTFKCLAPFSKGGYDKPKTYEYEGFEVDLNNFKVNLQEDKYEARIRNDEIYRRYVN